MRRTLSFMIVISLTSLSGCTAPETLFTFLGDYYSGGGTTNEEKKYHFDREVEKWDNFDKYDASH